MIDRDFENWCDQVCEEQRRGDAVKLRPPFVVVRQAPYLIREDLFRSPQFTRIGFERKPYDNDIRELLAGIEAAMKTETRGG